jgi:transposase
MEMNLPDDSLRQIDKDYINSLSLKKLQHLSEKMLEDLREARDRLNQTPENSSRPSGSLAPWEKGSKRQTEEQKEDAEKSEDTSVEGKSTQTNNNNPAPKSEPENKRNAGKQPGAKGFGRCVALPITGEEVHKPSECSACGELFEEDTSFYPKTGRHELDIEQNESGLEVSHIKHIYGACICSCGHKTHSAPGRSNGEEGWEVEITEWHLVGPTLVALIVSLAMRMRLSRKRIQEFLNDWLGIKLSVGTINQCILECGRAVSPLEDEFISEIQKSGLLFIDETGWQENGKLKWLWVLRTATVTLYMIGKRSWDVIADVMEKFAGWLMSDGYLQYRKYGKRLRCLAHIIRKARGLSESYTPEARVFGEKVLEIISLFITGIYKARSDPGMDLEEKFSAELAELKEWSEKHRDHNHAKTKALARELLNDWDAIWTVLKYPMLPITNNLAERLLRHWVIARKINLGTRTPEGSRAYVSLASVIDTCRQRGILPWPYIASVVAERRKGNSVPPIPQFQPLG